MATIKHGEEEKVVADGGSIITACEELDLPFGCQEGVCGSCDMEVEEGMENLSEMTENEEQLITEDNHRLACQCKIKSGEVKIKF